MFGVTTLSAAVLLSQTASPPQTEEFKSDEYLILGSPNRGAGEPMVVVNPKDSNNIIVVAMATLNRLPTGETPLPRGRGAAGALTAPGTAGAPPAADPARTALRIKELSTPDGSRTDIAVTHDGGKGGEAGDAGLNHVRYRYKLLLHVFALEHAGWGDEWNVSTISAFPERCQLGGRAMATRDSE